MAPHEIRIHIDQKPFHSPTRSAGSTLYQLGAVKPGLVLYKEVSGDDEDPVVPNDATEVHLKEDEHFHSGEPIPPEFKIIVNGVKRSVPQDLLTYDQLVEIAFPGVPRKPDDKYLISYEDAKSTPHIGKLVDGQSVTVKKHGTEFNVSPTNRS
jgi:multiubiquitin